MPGRERWWQDEACERFWLESTKRQDIGTDLRAPVGDGASDKAWRYELFKEAQVGDVVFHYDGNLGAVTAVSRIAGPWEARRIVWAARGTSARRRGAVPTESDGYFVPLDDHRSLPAILPLDTLRAQSERLRTMTSDLQRRHRRALYFPFELSNRPVRPLQGYAFKLPSAVVAGFPELRAGLQPHEAAWLDRDLAAQATHLDIAAVAAALNTRAEGRPIGGLQALRREIRGQARTKTQRLFSPDSIKPDYAFHSGGRDELQFNIGLDEFADGSPAFRVGVAFSLETSRSLPTIDGLVPKIRRFNDFLRSHPEVFADMDMWHWQGDRSCDRAPGPVDPDLAVEGVFIFLGVRQPTGTVDIDACLTAFDRLLPLWRYVESGVPIDAEPRPTADLGLRLDRGRLSKPARWAMANFRERQLNVELRHNAIQERLRDVLHERYGPGCVVLEPPVVGRYVDAVLSLPSGVTFYEVKTADTVRQCLREALGQLLDYALWPGGSLPDRLVVVGEPALDHQSAEYLERLNARFSISIEYESVPLP